MTIIIQTTDIFRQLRRDALQTVEDRVFLQQLYAVLAGAPLLDVNLPLQPVHDLLVLSVPQVPRITEQLVMIILAWSYILPVVFSKPSPDHGGPLIVANGSSGYKIHIMYVCIIFMTKFGLYSSPSIIWLLS